MKKFFLIFILSLLGFSSASAQTIYSWGYGSSPLGEVLGYGELSQDVSTPANPPSLAGSWKCIESNWAAAYGIKTDGTLWTWGSQIFNVSGMHFLMGIGSTTDLVQNTPVQIGSDNNWAKIFVGQSSVFGLKTDGSLWAWGMNYYGNLGLGDTTYRSNPVRIGTDNNWNWVAPGKFMTLAVKTDGTLWFCGHTPLVDAFNAAAFAQLIGGDTATTFRQVPLISNWNKVYLPTSISTENLDDIVFGIKNDGNLVAIGTNNYGQLGSGSNANFSVIPAQITGPWSSVSIYLRNVVGVKTDGSLWSWGTSVADAANVRRSPEMIGTDNDWTAALAGDECILALKRDSTLLGIGNNSNYQLGDANLGIRTNPTAIGPTGVKYYNFTNSEKKTLAVGTPLPVIQSNAEVSYIIPDVGAPGMNVYTEIIGPTGSFGNFGSDRTIREPYSDNNLKIEFRRSDDEKKIAFGPLTVSWGGRMISTQIFVNPGLAMPTTSFWNQLDDQYVIQFRVVSGNSVSEWQKFYIVKPFHFGDLTANTTDVVIGAGNLGKRSPRGAMVVDSLNLANITYSVDTTDCDPNLPGNQGFLPFVLLSQGNINGPAVINAGGNGANGGPGGGGGGGRFCDANLMNTGSRGNEGGSGFVSGGRGGFNNSGLSVYTQTYKNLGSGTADSGLSINGVLPAGVKWFESSGGGTGHPFGVSGRAAWVQEPDEGNNAVGYGGGSGGTQKTIGGGAGNSSVGVGSNAFNAGRIYGNSMVVPIAGGSGGASGNPNGQGDCSGSGGGGGGAIRIFAKNIYNININADGANGGTGDQSTHGGGGSGGYCGVFVKNHAEAVTASALGGYSGTSGSRNGAGRIRFDITNSGIGITSNPTEAYANHTGFTTDTTHLVLHNFTLKGTKSAGDTLDIYYKALNGAAWIPAGNVSANSVSWQFPMNLVGSDSVYYLYAERRHAVSGRIDSCQYTPRADYSQAAANILFIDKLPELTCDSSSYIYVGSYCDGKVKFDTVQIKNTGLAPLHVQLANAVFIHATPGFDFSPKENLTIAPNASESLIISYSVQPGVTGMIYDTLEFAHNDKTKNEIWDIACSAKVDKVDAAFVDADGNEIFSLDTIAMCTFDTIRTTIKVKNKTTDYFLFGNLQLSTQNPADSVSFAAVPKDQAILPDSAQYIDLTIAYGYNTYHTGTFTDTLYLRADGCDDIVDTLEINVHVYQLELSADEQKIDSVCVGNTLEGDIMIRNGNIFAQELTLKTEGTGFTAAPAALTIPALDSAKIHYVFNSTGFADGIYPAVFTLGSAKCASEFSVSKQIKVYHPEMKINAEYDFGEIPVGQSRDSVITVYNSGSSPIYLSQLPVAGAPFNVTASVPAVPVVISSGDSIKLTVRFTPSAPGDVTAPLLIASTENPAACALEAKSVLKGYGAKTQVELNKYNTELANHFGCLVGSDTIIMTNTGETEIYVDSVYIDGKDAEFFSIIYPANPALRRTLVPADTAWFIVNYAAPKKYGRDTAALKFKGSVNIPSCELTTYTAAETFSVNPGPYKINLGTMPVGATKEIPITFRVPSDTLTMNELFRFDQKPNIAVTNLPEFTVHTSQIDTSAVIKATIYAQKTGWDTVAVYFHALPCDTLDSLTFVYYGTQSIVKRDTLNWGILTPCDVLHDTLYLKNTKPEDGDLTVSEITLAGIDAAFFKIDSVYSYPVTIKSKDSMAVPVTFAASAVDGIKNAEIDVRYINSLNDDYFQIFEMTGEIRKGTALPAFIAFDTTMVGDNQIKTLTIRNTSGYEMKIDSVRILQNQVYSAIPLPAGNIDGRILAPGDSLVLEIVFSPKDSVYYRSNLFVYYTVKECQQKAFTVLEGNGLLKFSVLHIELPDITDANPAAGSLDLPVTAWIEEGGTVTEFTDADLNFEMLYNGKLYYPKSVIPNGSTVSINSNFGTGAQIALHHLNITTEKKSVGIITGVPILGDTIFTQLIIRNPQIDQAKYGRVTMMPKDGSIKYKVCTSGGERLLTNTNPLYVKISPNPASSGRIKIDVSTLEAGNHSLIISDEAGRIIYERAWKAEKISDTKVFEIETSDFSSGIYFVKVISPNGSTTEKFRIVR